MRHLGSSQAAPNSAEPVTAQAWLTPAQRVPPPWHGLRHLHIPRGSAPNAQLRLEQTGATSDYPTAPIGGSSRTSAEQALSLGAIGSVSAGGGPFAGRWQPGTWAWELPGSSQRALAMWLGGRSSVPGLGCGVRLRMSPAADAGSPPGPRCESPG